LKGEVFHIAVLNESVDTDSSIVDYNINLEFGVLAELLYGMVDYSLWTICGTQVRLYYLRLNAVLFF
jgi:hypothetical protein